jgi:hypothetical protein
MMQNARMLQIFGEQTPEELSDAELLEAVRADIVARLGTRDLAVELSERVLQAVEFVLDPVRTGRTKIVQLDNVEKTFIGLKVEHFVRDLFDAPKGVRDLVLAGHDVDVKNTVGARWCWMIPPESFRTAEPCLLIAANDHKRLCWMGLIRTRDEYLGAPNRDGKRAVKASAFGNILWLVEAQPWPADRWLGIDMARFRELRGDIKYGSPRAAVFFSENLRRPIHRSVVLALLHDQLDPMKRLRGNGGAKDLLRSQGIALVSGNYFNGVLEQLGLPRIGNDEHIAVDIRAPEDEAILQAVGQVD